MQALTHEDRISKAKIFLYKLFPFFSYLVENMSIYSDKDKVPTMGVNAKSECYYNPKFIEKLSNDELMGTLCHEVLHLAYNHPRRGEHRRIMVGNISLWNIAIDLIVNNTLVANNIKLPEEGLIPCNDSYTFFGCEINNISEKSGEDIYEELKKHFQQMMKQQKKQKGKGQGSGDGSGKGKGEGEKGDKNVIPITIPEDEKTGFDEHDFEDREGEGSSSGKEGKESKEGMKDGEGSGSSGKTEEKDWNKITATAFNFAKQRGTEPAGMGREFQIYNKSYINWRAYLHREVSKLVPKNYCWSRPAKKYLSQNIYLPHIKGEQVKVLFSIDTSGSVGTEELSKFITEILAVARSFNDIEFRLISHDAQVWEDYYIANGNINKIKELKLSGNGGTDHNPLYEYIKKMKYDKTNNLLFSMTDGFSSYPAKPCINTIFILAGNYDRTQIPSWNRGIVELK